MPNLAIDDDLRHDFEGAFKVASTANDQAFFDQFLQPTQNAPAGDKAGQGSEGAGGADQVEPPAGSSSGGPPAASGGVDASRETQGSTPDASGFPVGPKADPATSLLNDPVWADLAKRMQEGAQTPVGPILKDVAAGMGEALPQALGGMLSAVNEAADTIDDLERLVGLDKIDPTVGVQRAEIGAAKTVTGGFIRSTAQFLTGFLPAMKAVKGISLGSKGLQAVEATALAGAVVLDPHEERLSTWLNTWPSLAGVVPDYLADNDPAHEGEWEGRLKNVLDQLPMAMVEPAWRILKYYKAQRAAMPAPAVTATQAGQAAARDATRDAAQGQLAPPVSAADLSPLGDEGADFYIKSDKPTLGEAVKSSRDVAASREKAAGERAIRVNTLDRVMEAVKAHGERIGAEADTAVDDGFDDLLDMARGGVAAGSRVRVARQYPMLSILKSEGGVKPGSPLALELERRGIKQKPGKGQRRLVPGLFKPNGRSAFDNVVASEHDLQDMADPLSGYIDTDKFFDALDDELAGRPSAVHTTEKEFQQEALAKEVDTFRRDLEALGVDFDTMDNAQIRSRLQAVEDERARFEAPPAESESEFGGLDPDEGVAPPVGEQPRIAAFHGTPIGGPLTLEARQPALGMKAIYVSTNRAHAEPFSRKGMAEGGQVIPLSVDGKIAPRDYVVSLYDEGLQTPEIRERLIREGYAGFYEDSAGEGIGVFDAASIKPAGEATAPPLPFTHLNYARINTAEDVQALLQRTVELDAENINIARRDVVSNKQTIKESKAEFQDLADLIGRPPAGAWNAAQMTAARNILSTSGKQLLELAEKASAGNATPADLVAFERASAVHYAIQAEVYGARAEAGRALQAWKIQAATDKQRGQQIAEMLANRGAGDTATFAKAMAALKDADPAAVNAFNRAMSTPTVRGAMFELWQGAMLTGPKTWLVNTLSNALTSFWNVPERLLAEGISNVFYDGEVKLGEAASMVYAMPRAALDGVKLAARVGTDPRTAAAFEAFTKVDRAHAPQFTASTFGASPGSALGMGINLLGMAVRGLSFEVLGTSDLFAKGFNYNLEMHSLAFRRAAEEGLEGQAMAERMRDIMLNPPPELIDAASKAAHELTFTSPLGPSATAFQMFLNKPMFGVQQLPSWRLLVPFFKTPVNIMKYAGRRTPVSFLFGETKRDIQAGGARAAQAWARIGASSMIMATIAGKVADGMITGNGPAEPDARRQWLSKNQPYSVKVGDRWYSYRRLEPLGMLFGMSADMAEVIGGISQQDAEDMTFAPVVAFAKNFASKTWTRGVIGALSALDQSSFGGPENLAMDLATSLMPGFVRTIAQANDPVLRDTRATVNDDFAKAYTGDLPPPVAAFLGEVINRYRDQVPGMSESLPARLDIFGRPVDMSSGLGWIYDFASPVASKPVGHDAVDDMLIENRIKLSMPERTIKGVKLTAEEYQAYVKMAGEPAHKELAIMVRDGGFKRLSGGPDGFQADLVKSRVSFYRQQAANQMMVRFPQIRARWLANEQRKNAKLIGAQ